MKRPSRMAMVRALQDAARADCEDLEDMMEDEDFDSMSMARIRSLYDEYINPSPIVKITGTEFAVEQFNAIVVGNKKNRTVDISIEAVDGQFLTSDNKRVARDLGEDMPVYTTMPQEVFEAIKRS